MTDDNKSIRLPSGGRAVRVIAGSSSRAYAVWGSPRWLTAADVEALYADSISGDGHGNTPPPESHGERRR